MIDGSLNLDILIQPVILTSSISALRSQNLLDNRAVYQNLIAHDTDLLQEGGDVRPWSEGFSVQVIIIHLTLDAQEAGALVADLLLDAAR